MDSKPTICMDDLNLSTVLINDSKPSRLLGKKKGSIRIHNEGTAVKFSDINTNVIYKKPILFFKIYKTVICNKITNRVSESLVRDPSSKTYLTDYN